MPLLCDDEHSFLRFTQHDFVRRHARFAFRHFGEIDFDSGAAAARRFAGRAGQTGCAHVLNAGDGIVREQFEARFQQQLFLERIADLHGRSIFARFLGQFPRSECRAGQTVAARFGADVKDRVADAAGGAAGDLLVSQDAEAKNIHQRIAFVTFVEINFAADCRDADAVPVMRDAGNDAGKQPAVRCDFGFDRSVRHSDRTEAQRIQQKLRARAHRENVADDSADAGCRALERLDRARVVVAFDLECDRPAVADVDHAGVFFACLDQNVRAGGRKFFQLSARIFVGAMLAPHDREDPQLGEVRFAAENFFDALVFFRREAVFAHHFGRNLRFRSHLLRMLTDVTVATTAGINLILFE